MSNKDEKTWTVVGTSVYNGERQLRLANGSAADRQRILEKAGCTDVLLWDLPSPMTRTNAEAWLAQQGTAVPVQRTPAPKPARAAPEPRGRTRPPVGVDARRAIRAVPLPDGAGEGPIMHEDLGREFYARGRRSHRPWKDMSFETRQEFSRNAAVRAGIACPPGTYPELEAFYRSENITVLPDGTLQDGPQAA